MSSILRLSSAVRRSSSGNSESKNRFSKHCLRLVNSYRADHGCSALKLNAELSKAADAWAQYLAKMRKLIYNAQSAVRGQSLGENIGVAWKNSSEIVSARIIISNWYKEITRYDFDTAQGCSTSNFTQLIWRSTSDVGFGKAFAKDDTMFLVAEFYPAGNVYSQFSDNVPPRLDSILPTFSDKITVLQRIHQTISEISSSEYRIATKVIETATTNEGEILTASNENSIVKNADSETLENGDIELVSISNKVLKDFVSSVVEQHNYFRKKHNSPKLQLDAFLSKMAQSWADVLASNGVLTTSNYKYDDEFVGENIAARNHNDVSDLSGVEVVNQWYNSGENYDYSEEEAELAGCFSQLLWRSSELVGVGQAISKADRNCFVVCFYHPAGNVEGRFRDNVLAPN